MQPRDQLERFVLGVEPWTTSYLNPIAFNYAVVFEQERFLEFLETNIRPRRTMFVGSGTKEAMERVFGHLEHHIQVPRLNAYQAFGSWFPKVVEKVHEVELVVFCAGVSTNVAMGILWNCGFSVNCINSRICCWHDHVH